MIKNRKLIKATAPWVLAIFMGLFAALEFSLSLVPNSYNAKNKNLLAQSQEIKCLVLGSSHGYFDIKPDELNLRTFNLANTSQSISQDLSLLKHFIGKLPNLQTVVIPISYFTLEYSNLDSPENWRDCYTFHFLGASEAEWWQILSNPKYLSLFSLYGPEKVREILKRKFSVSYANDTDGSGWYSGDYGSAINFQSATERVQAVEGCMKSKYFEMNCKRLNEILLLCKSHSVKVIFVTTPVHALYYQQIDKNRWSETQRVIRQLIENFNAVYLDFSQDAHFKETDFRDNDHLNLKGAILFSRILDKIISQHSQVFDNDE